MKSHSNIPPFFRDYAYLLLIDLEMLILWNRGVKEFEEKEPNYTGAFLNAYHKAFTTNINGQINVSYLEAVHGEALSHLPLLKGGAVINDSTYFTAFTQTRSPSASASIDGVREFIDFWFYQAEYPIHILTFETQEKSGFGLKVDQTCTEERKLLWVETRDKKIISEDIYSHEVYFKKIISLLASKDYMFYINCLTMGPRIHGFRTHKELFTLILKKLCDDYNSTIKNLFTDDEKLKTIIKFCHRYLQLHAFLDGNTRTAYIHLNKLLSEEKLDQTLLINPNRLDCFSINELMEIVKQGQHNFKNLVLEILPEPDISPNKIKPYQLNVSEEMLGNFYKNITEKKPHNESSPSFFSHKNIQQQKKQSTCERILACNIM